MTIPNTLRSVFGLLASALLFCLNACEHPAAGKASVHAASSGHFGNIALSKPQRYRLVPVKQLPNLLRPAKFDIAKYPNFEHLQGLLTCKKGTSVCPADVTDGLSTGISWNSLAEAQIVDDHTLRFKVMGSNTYGFNPKIFSNKDMEQVVDYGDAYDISLESPTKGRLIKYRYNLTTGELWPLDPTTYKFEMIYLGDGRWLRTSAMMQGKGFGPLTPQPDYYLVQAFDENGPTKHFGMALDDAVSTNTPNFLVTVDEDSDLGRGAPLPTTEYVYVDDAKADSADAAADSSTTDTADGTPKVADKAKGR